MAVINTTTRNKIGRKRSVLAYRAQSITERTQGRSLRQTVEEHPLLACSLTQQARLPRDGTAHRGLSPLHH